LRTQNDRSSPLKDIFNGIFYIAITIGIFILTYYSTRFISKRSLEASKTKNMKLIEKVSVGKDKDVALMKVGDQFYLVGISATSVSFSTPLSDAAAEAIDESTEFQVNGLNVLNGVFESYRMQTWMLKLSGFLRKLFRRSG